MTGAYARCLRRLSFLMSEQPVLDEGALANDIVRLLGSENQRLKRELREAQQRAQSAESQIRALAGTCTTVKVRSGNVGHVKAC